MARIYIGTSGWSFDDWIGSFYPRDVNKNELLRYYAKHFKTAEINNTFYQLPTKKTFRHWMEESPKDFLFSVKASRFITHMKKLKEPEEGLKNFLDAVGALEGKLGPILFQLPPNWRVNPERLETFLEAIPKKQRATFEFRDESWFTEEIYDLLKERNAAFCLYDMAGRRAPIKTTADFVYVRLHGPERKYEGNYDGRTLAGWVKRFRGWRREGRDVYCYFDNDKKSAAVQDAKKMTEMLKG